MSIFRRSSAQTYHSSAEIDHSSKLAWQLQQGKVG
jgi:hypothetical protein